MVKHVGPGNKSKEWPAVKKQREEVMRREMVVLAELAKVKVPGIANIVAMTLIEDSPAIVLEYAGST